MSAASKDDADEQLVLNILDSDELDPAATSEPPELVGELVRVRSIMRAFDSLGVAQPATPPPIPSWGPFVLREQVGRGRFGTVCRGFDPHVQREIAVKLYAAGELPAEPRLMARVRHPNVVTVFGAAVHEDRPGIWMEYIHGQTLGHRVQADGPLPPDEVLRIGIALCDALAAVHAAQLVHQDIKPRNVMQEDSGRVVLMDFGAGLSEDESAPERFAGTPVYMAPEVVLGQRPSVESDIYSLGVLLYYLLTGTYPVYAPDLEELRRLHERHHRTGTRRFVATLRELRPEVSPALARALAKALAPVGQRYKTAEEFEVALETIRLGGWGRPRLRVGAWIAAGLILALGLAGGLGIGRRGAERSVALEHLTFNEGLAADPAVSPDGKFMAYASDRSGEGHLDIWLQQMAGSPPLRLTHDGVDDSEPSFFPDGTKIIFRSERDGGGLYVVPTFGGDVQRITKGGRWPRFSPDGRYVAYINDGMSVTLMSPEGQFVRELAVTTPPDSAPVWSPDSAHIVVVAVGLEGIVSDWAAWDWVALSIDGRLIVPMGAIDILGRQRHSSQETLPTPWHWQNDHISFNAGDGDVMNLWQVDVMGLHCTGIPRRLTTAPGTELQPSETTEGRLVFSEQSEAFDLWALPLNADGVATSEPHALRASPTRHLLESISEDGRWLTFVSHRLGRPQVWLYDFTFGAIRPVTDTPITEGFPVITRDGSDIFYQSVDKGRAAVYNVHTPNSLPHKVCDDCGFATDLSPNGRFLLLQQAYRGYANVEVFDVSTGTRVTLLKHPDFTFYRTRFSSDGRWIVFHTSHRRGPTQEFVARFDGPKMIPPSAWIPVTDGKSMTDAPRWSVDGNRIYYLSKRDGHLCIWVQRLDPDSKTPAGEAIAVYHAHERQRSLDNVVRGGADLAVARDKIVFSMGEIKGNVWSAGFH